MLGGLAGGPSVRFAPCCGGGGGARGELRLASRNRQQGCAQDSHGSADVSCDGHAPPSPSPSSVSLPCCSTPLRHLRRSSAYPTPIDSRTTAASATPAMGVRRHASEAMPCSAAALRDACLGPSTAPIHAPLTPRRPSPVRRRFMRLPTSARAWARRAAPFVAALTPGESFVQTRGML